MVMCFDLMMNHFQLFILFFLFVFQSEAQDASTTLNGPPRNLQSVDIITGVLVVFFLIFVTLSVFIYLKYCYRPTPDLSSPQNNFHQLFRSNSSSSGIDRSVIESIPFFKFSSLKGPKEGLECSVCLSKFEDSEVLRLLPKCKHAFHMNCIDEWLESHSSCPICRYKFDSTEFMSYNYTSSLRYNGNLSPLILMDSPSLELLVEREEDRDGSTIINFGNSFKKLNKLGNADSLTLEGEIEKKFHKLKHKIIVSDVFHKRRWSDLNSSDLMSLNSEMLNCMSSKRFNSNSPKHNLSMNGQELKTNEDMESKTISESKMDKINHTRWVSGSSALSPPFTNEESKNINSRLVSSTEKRSRSEITISARSIDFQVWSNRTTEPLSMKNNSRDERIWRIWLPIARQTFHRFAAQENNFDISEIGTLASNV